MGRGCVPGPRGPAQFFTLLFLVGLALAIAAGPAGSATAFAKLCCAIVVARGDGRTPSSPAPGRLKMLTAVVSEMRPSRDRFVVELGKAKAKTVE